MKHAAGRIFLTEQKRRIRKKILPADQNRTEREGKTLSSIIKRRFSDNEGNVATIRIVKESNLFHVVIFNKYGQSLFHRFYSSTQAARKAIIRKGFSELKE